MGMYKQSCGLYRSEGAGLIIKKWAFVLEGQVVKLFSVGFVCILNRLLFVVNAESVERVEQQTAIWWCLRMCWSVSTYASLFLWHKFKDESFSSLSTGFPNEPAAEIALKTVHDWIEANQKKVGAVRSGKLFLFHRSSATSFKLEENTWFEGQIFYHRKCSWKQGSVGTGIHSPFPWWKIN